MKGTLTSENPLSEVISFVGSAAILVYGEGTVTIERSVSGSNFFPMTDGSGGELSYEGFFEDDVILNTCIDNPKLGTKFRIRAKTASNIQYIVSEW